MTTRRCPHCWRRTDVVSNVEYGHCPRCRERLAASTASAEVEDVVRARLYGGLHAAVLSVAPRSRAASEDG